MGLHRCGGFFLVGSELEHDTIAFASATNKIDNFYIVLNLSYYTLLYLLVIIRAKMHVWFKVLFDTVCPVARLGAKIFYKKIELLFFYDPPIARPSLISISL